MAKNPKIQPENPQDEDLLGQTAAVGIETDEDSEDGEDSPAPIAKVPARTAKTIPEVKQNGFDKREVQIIEGLLSRNPRFDSLYALMPKARAPRNHTISILNDTIIPKSMLEGFLQYGWNINDSLVLCEKLDCAFKNEENIAARAAKAFGKLDKGGVVEIPAGPTKRV